MNEPSYASLLIAIVCLLMVSNCVISYFAVAIIDRLDRIIKQLEKP